MALKCVGLIETLGLASAVEAADTAVKSANVKLIGYEYTRGDGMCTVKVEGDVGAVKAAIAAASASASKVWGVYSTTVIARPAEGIDMLLHNAAATIGYEDPKQVKAQSAAACLAQESTPLPEAADKPVEENEAKETAEQSAEEAKQEESIKDEKVDSVKEEVKEVPKKTPRRRRNSKKQLPKDKEDDKPEKE